jgi:hypothetical protein
MFQAALVVLVASALAGLAYLRLEHAGPRVWVPAACRAVAWSALGLLLLNVSCPSAGVPRRPLALLDGSISMGAAGGRWREALDSARRWGDVRLFGDEHSPADTAPTLGRSLLGPALAAAAASDRPIIIASDGEVEDAGDVPPELLARASVRLFPRTATPDLAVTAIDGPTRVTSGDSIALDVTVERESGSAADTAQLEVASGSSTVARRRVRLGAGASGRARVAFSSTVLGPGDHLLRIQLAHAGDREPRTDLRLHLVTVAPTPGVVLIAAPADWDSRFLYRTLKEVAQLPVRGFVRLEADRWRAMADLRPVAAEEVRRAARGADLLILKGAAGAFAEGTNARGIWQWPSGEGGGPPSIAGDWYLSGDESSPIGSAFLGQPVDSFPPALQLTPMQPAAGDWVGLTAQLGRRGAPRPAWVGRVDGRVRRITTLVDGLWRWGFRGGSSEESYRALVASAATWLLAGTDTASGVARPVRRVVQQGRPLVFEWVGPGAASPTAVTWTSPDGTRPDTLRFDGAGRASVWLPPGTYRYRLGGSGGIVAVEEYSDELLPRPITLHPRNGAARPAGGRTMARDWLWLFGLCVLAFAGEWLARRRLGLR